MTKKDSVPGKLDSEKSYTLNISIKENIENTHFTKELQVNNLTS